MFPASYFSGHFQSSDWTVLKIRSMLGPLHTKYLKERGDIITQLATAEAVEVASDKDDSLCLLGKVFWACPSEAPGKTQDTMERLYLLGGLGTLRCVKWMDGWSHSCITQPPTPEPTGLSQKS